MKSLCMHWDRGEGVLVNINLFIPPFTCDPELSIQRQCTRICKTTFVSFYIAQKQCVKDSGWFSISGNDSLCKQTSDEAVRVVPRNRLLILQSLSFRNSPVGKASVKIMSELSSYVSWICCLQDKQSLTHVSATELITSCWHSHVLRLPWMTCADVLPACTYNVWSLSIERMKSD